MKTRHVLVIGLGRFGASLVEALWEARADTIVIDASAESVDAVKDRAGHAVIGDATDPRVLESLGAREVDVAVVTFGHDFESSVLAVSALRRLGVGTVIARAETRRKAEVLRAIGATRVLEIEAESGRRLAGDLVSPIAADLLALADSYRVVPWVAEGALVGKSLVDAQLRQRFALNVLGIRPAGAAKGARLELPRPEHVIQKGDTLLLVGEAEHVTRFFRTEGEG